MSDYLLQIDLSNLDNKIENDLIKIRFGDEDVIQVNFSKLVNKSNYIRDKYKYSEALDFLQNEIEEIETNYNINEKSVKLFIQLIQEEKINIPVEHYKDFYTLSEYFQIPQFTSILDNISRKDLYKDLNFTIQILLDSETAKDSLETKLTCKIENFLKERINECIKNSKFKELPLPTIFRILDQGKENVDQNLLVDFIFESADTRSILLKFVEIDKLEDKKVEEFIKFIDEQDENSKTEYSEIMSFNLSFIKNMKIKYDKVLNEMNKTKQELNQTKQELNQTKQELNQTKQEFNQTKQEFNQTKQEFNQTKQEFNQTKQELNQTKQEFNQTKQEFNQTKQDLNQTKQEFNQTKQEFNQTKQEFNQTKQELNQTKQNLNQTKQELNQTKQDLNQANIKYKQKEHELNQIEEELKLIKQELKQYGQSIIVCGFDKYNQLGEKPNNKNKIGEQIIHPPVNLSLDTFSLQSYSAYNRHSVLVMSDGSLKGIGSNDDGRISSTLQKTVIKDFTDFSIKDGSGRQLTAISAVCYVCGTLYMFSKSDRSGRQLVLCDKDINGGDPVFLDIGNRHPVSLFGGDLNSAAICSEGEIIFINRNSVKKSPNSPIAAFSLPDSEKASSVACCDDSVVVLSSKGRVFDSNVDKENSVLNFSPVSELSGQEIVCVSGTYKHFLAVSKEGRVFVRGSNEYGQLGLGKETKSVLSFTEIPSLVGYEIREAYAGGGHSLFETREGKILSCGWNMAGQLLLSSDPGENVDSPTETTITSGASFCIAGYSYTIVFIGIHVPPNTPNKGLQFHYVCNQRI